MRYFLDLSDTEFAEFAIGFKNELVNSANDLNFDADEIAEVESAVEKYVADLKNQRESRDSYNVATIVKKNSKVNARKLIAGFANRLRANGDVADHHLVAFGLTVRDEILSESKMPEGEPFLTIEIRPHRVHKLEIRNGENMARAKPESATGAEVWCFIGDKKDLTEKNLRYLGTATRSKFTTEHDLEDAGKTAHYKARWINRRGITGGWSSTTSATIAG